MSKIARSCGWLKQINEEVDLYAQERVDAGEVYSITDRENLRAALHVCFFLRSHGIDVRCDWKTSRLSFPNKETVLVKVETDFTKYRVNTEDADYMIAVFYREAKRDYALAGWAKAGMRKLRDIDVASDGTCLGEKRPLRWCPKKKKTAEKIVLFG